MSDLIDRQVAIEAPKRYINDCNPEHFAGHQKFIEFMDNAEIGSFGSWRFAHGFNMGLIAAEVAIKHLPPAQPEIIRCKDCTKYDTHDHRCKHWNHGVVVNDWCSRAERRTDG